MGSLKYKHLTVAKIRPSFINSASSLRETQIIKGRKNGVADFFGNVAYFSAENEAETKYEFKCPI